MIETALAWLGLKAGPVIGGFFGALCSLRLFPGLGFWQGVTTFAFGWASASFLAPWLASLIGAGPEHLASMGFLTGLLVLGAAYNIMKAMPEWASAVRKRFIGGAE